MVCRGVKTLWTVLLAAAVPAALAVEFPGPQPGRAESRQRDGVLTLENAVLAASWREDSGTLRPVALVNRLTGARFAQDGTELFRLATKPEAPAPEGCTVAVCLKADRVIALASRDGLAWGEIGSFPRAAFPGEPRLIRIGKMDLKAQARNHGDPGAEGACLITALAPPPAAPDADRFVIQARANQAAVREYPFPAGATRVACRIDRGTDQGMSWAPALALIWEDGQKFLLVGLREKNPVFNLTTAEGERITGAHLGSYPALDLPASAFRLAAPPRVARLPAGGVALEAELTAAPGLRARWRAELRDGAHYVRQTLELSTPQPQAPLFGVELCDVRLPEAETIGRCPGSPVAGGGMFLGVEMPGAQNALDGSTGARIGFPCRLELSPRQPYSFAAVAGVAPAGQLRRAFLCYIERERARPARPFLHYNGWYDLGYSVNASNVFDVVTRFDEELVRKRGVPVQAYLVDDGWDDVRAGLWAENLKRFPGGFRALKARMDPLGAHLGIWISPLGGYGGAKERTELARQAGLIPAEGELDLAQPRYRQWFEERCRQLMREDGVTAFKWDKAGEGVSPHFMALLGVAHALRRENPELFINVTVGTWPSPFWLNHVDATWRNGSSDVGWTGKGDDREQWLTFRDGYCRKLFVEKAPLYPLNAVMHHGIVHGRCFQGDKVGKSGPHLKNEARSYFASGAMLQELYLTPSLMTPEAWDRVAEAARWAHAHAEVLVDAHWVGGDPLALEPYGYAAWSPRRGTLMLRNPADQPRTFALDAATAFELPAGAAQRYTLRAPYADQRVQTLTLAAGQPQEVALEPFEVLVFDAVGR